MMHDIAHCGKLTCPKRYTCYRFLAYLEAVETDREYYSMVVIDKDKEGENCTAYWEVL